MATAVAGPPMMMSEGDMLDQALKTVRYNGFQMEKAIDSDDLGEALRFSYYMLRELRASPMSPQLYYSLYMEALERLRPLEAFFVDLAGRSMSYTDLYERVQHCGAVLPRLYLMCTVGGAYLRSADAQDKYVMRDMAEMCKGVQHPLRGLFLRNYLHHMTRDRLLQPLAHAAARDPVDVDQDLDEEGAGEDARLTVVDALEFLMLNFVEMNKLWVRMQQQVGPGDLARREAERRQLEDLVGKNLQAISQLDGVTLEIYARSVLPRVLDQVVACQDVIAQQYLMECLIQTFPDEFHLRTLSTLMGAIPSLQPGIRLHAVIGGLLTRLGEFAAKGSEHLQLFREVDAAVQLERACKDIIEGPMGTSMPGADLVKLHMAQLRFTASMAPTDTARAERILQSAASRLASRAESGAGVDGACMGEVVALLQAVVDCYGVSQALAMEHFLSLRSVLSFPWQYDLAVALVDNTLRIGKEVFGLEAATALYDLLAPLIADPPGPNLGGSPAQSGNVARVSRDSAAYSVHGVPSPHPISSPRVSAPIRGPQSPFSPHGSGLVSGGWAPRQPQALSTPYAPGGGFFRGSMVAGSPEFLEQQTQVAKLAHLLAAPGDAQLLEVYRVAFRALVEGGPSRVGVTLEPLAFLGMPLARRSKADKELCQEAFYFVLQVGQALVDAPCPDQGMRVMLRAAVAASQGGAPEAVVYTMLEEAFVVFEDHITGQRMRLETLGQMVGALCACPSLDKDTRDTFGAQVLSYAGLFLRRADQCKAALMVSRVFWCELAKNGAGVARSLERALRACQRLEAQQLGARREHDTTPAAMYCAVLQAMQERRSEGCEEVTDAMVSGVVAQVEEALQSEHVQRDAELAALCQRVVKMAK